MTPLFHPPPPPPPPHPPLPSPHPCLPSPSPCPSFGPHFGQLPLYPLRSESPSQKSFLGRCFDQGIGLPGSPNCPAAFNAPTKPTYYIEGNKQYYPSVLLLTLSHPPTDWIEVLHKKSKKRLLDLTSHWSSRLCPFRCARCLSSGHMAKDCRDPIRCLACNGNGHRASPTVGVIRLWIGCRAHQNALRRRQLLTWVLLCWHPVPFGHCQNQRRRPPPIIIPINNGAITRCDD